MGNVIKKILLINDTNDDNNIGCKATTNALYELIDERLPNYIVNDVIKLYHTERPEIDNYIPYDLGNIDSICTQWLSSNINDECYFEMQKVMSSDIIVINGEGSIYKDVLKCRYQLFIAYLAKKFLSKKVYIINHTADISLVKEFAQKVYSIIDGIVVREPISKRQLESIGINNAILAPDAVFKYNFNDKGIVGNVPFGFDINKKYIIIGGTSLNHPIYEKWNGPWDRNNFYKLIYSIRDKFGIQVLLADVGGDDFLRTYDRIQGVYYGKFNYLDYIKISSKALLHLSGRHHGSCLAALSACPLIGLTANTHKMLGDFELLDWDLPVFDFYEIGKNLNKIIETVEYVITNNKVLRGIMKKKVSDIQNDVNLNVDILDT